MIEALSNGLGGQSMYLLWMACERQIPARYSITADTGSEEDRILCDGSRISAGEFFRKHVSPMASRRGIAAYFVRSRFKDGTELPPLHEQMASGGLEAQNVPLFGSEGGRLRQTCTDKWKMRAIRQQLRRLGATKKARSAVGLHVDEYMRRQSGIPLGKFVFENLSYVYYQTVNGSRKEPKPVKWMEHYYPIVDMKLGRQAVRDRLDKLGIPYLLTSECDHCPHKDDSRWLATSQETIDRVAKIEEVYDGEFFFTDRRIPLKLAIEEMRKNPKPSDPIFGCHNAYCGV